jgi:hypothetical protein
MYTEIAYMELVERTLNRIGADFEIEFERPSTAVMLNYPRGKWLYDTRSDMSVVISRWATGHQEGKVERFRDDERRPDFEIRLEKELREEILKLHDEKVTVCSHSLSDGPPILLFGEEPHTCRELSTSPGSQCRCDPREMPLAKYERLFREATVRAANA